MAKQGKPLERLPKAPLVEAVFELRWRLQEGPPSQPSLHADPGLLPLMEAFTHKMKAARYTTTRDMSHPLATGAYGVVRRYFLSPEKPYPIMQIGPGIFATNDGPLYSWKSFRSQVKAGVQALLTSYPDLRFFKLQPISLELRYVDVFDKSVLGSKGGLIHFINGATTLKIEPPALIKNHKIVTGNVDGRFAIQQHLKEREDSLFLMDLGSGKNTETGDNIVRLETKVLTGSSGVPRYRQNAQFIKALDAWLVFAHNILSPFFGQFIRSDVMAKFKGP